MANIEYTSKSLAPFEEKMKKTISVLKSEFQTIRAGRANPRILDNISVSYYGVDTPLNQVANIQVPEARMLMITPWDKTLLKELERAVQASNIGIHPMNDGQSLRLVFPPLTEERRQELTRDVSQMGEDAKVSVRNIRREAIDLYKKYLKESDISENLYYTVEANIQQRTDRYVELIDIAISELLSRQDYLVVQGNDLAKAFGGLKSFEQRVLDYCFSFVTKESKSGDVYEVTALEIIKHFGLNTSGDSYRRIAEAFKKLNENTALYLNVERPDGTRGLRMAQLFSWIDF